MRIAIVVPEFPPFHIGGGGIVFEELARHYAEKNEVRVFSAHDQVRSWINGSISDESDIDRSYSTSRYPLAPIRNQSPHLRTVIPPNPRSAFAFYRDFSEWKATVCHLHGYGYAFVDFGALAARHRRVPYIFTCHGLPTTPARHGRLFSGSYRLYQSVGARRTLAGAATITAVSKSVGHEIQALSKRTVQVIPNGLTRLPDVWPEDVARLRDKLGIREAEVVVVAAGRLAHAKGFDILVAALDMVEVDNLVCIVAGDDGGELSNLVNMGQGLKPGRRVVLPGRLDRADLAALFTLADVVAVPSRNEPFGLVALEALAMSCRVVATSAGGITDFLASTCAILVRPDDARSLATGISAGIKRGGPSDHEAASARAILNNLTWSSISKSYVRLLEAAVDGNSNSTAPVLEDLG
ncbi:MAG: glycosyltransferase family 4 protein [Acidimicrobiales bacterium]|jgi:glycosyltransferase involved in cell wall biosynthesis